MSQISEFRNPWRDILLSAQASFRGVMFHVENVVVSSGRRTVVHEYPKRDDPYSEDMGRIVKRFQFAAYLVYRPGNPLYVYTQQRLLLKNALEQDDTGSLIHPVYCPGSGLMVMCERFSVTESRERGGYTQFEMQFAEVGDAVSSLGVVLNTASQVGIASTNVETSATGSSNAINSAQGINGKLPAITITPR